MLAEKAQSVQCTTILKMAQVAKEEKSHETRAAFLASMRDYDHAIKATTIAKDLPASMRAERAAELRADGSLSAKDIVKALRAEFGISRNEAYEIATRA